jgi:hypothetical protein
VVPDGIAVAAESAGAENFRRQLTQVIKECHLMKRLLWIMASLLLMASALVAAPIYSQNFNSWAPTTIPTSAASGSDYWYYVNNTNTSYYGGGSMTMGTTAGAGGINGTKWVLSGNSTSGTSNGHFNGFAYRNFRTAGTLSASQSITDATVSAYLRNNAGGNTVMQSRLWLVDDAGNGYSGVAVRDGNMTLYKSVGWALTSIGTYASGVGGNDKYCSISVVGGNITFSFQYTTSAGAKTGTVYTKTVADSTYTAFTTIGIGGAYFSGEGMGFDDVELTGVIPEPATAGLLAVAGALVLMRRRKRENCRINGDDSQGVKMTGGTLTGSGGQPSPER